MNRTIKKVAVLGSGVMGSRIACHFANIGVQVLLLDIVPKEPNEFEISPPASSEIASVKMFKLAPNAPDPLVDVPTPRCNCKLCVEDAKSPKLTQNVP